MLGKLFARKAETVVVNERRDGERRPVENGSVELDGVRYPLVNWSYSGFLARDYTGDRKSRERVDVKLTFELDDGPFEFTSKAYLVQVDRDGNKLVGSLVEMSPALRVEMARRVGNQSKS